MREIDIGFEDFSVGHFESTIVDDLEFNKPPRPKIRGSQHIKREEKKKPKLIIRKPFIKKSK